MTIQGLGNSPLEYENERVFKKKKWKLLQKNTFEGREKIFRKYAFGKYSFHYMITTKMMMFEKNVLDDHLTTFAVIQHVGICVRNL